MKEKKEFYGYLWIKGKPEDIDEWLSGEAESFVRRFYVEECEENNPEDVYVSEEPNGLTPWFGDTTNEEGMVIRNYQLGDSYWTEDDEPLDIEKIECDYCEFPLDKLSFCFISVAVEDFPDTGEDPEIVERSCYFNDSDGCGCLTN